MRLVETSNRRGDTIAAGVRLTAKADVTAEVVGIRASNGSDIVARTVVAVRTRCDKLNTAENCGLGANTCVDGGVREVDISTHITEHGSARGGKDTSCGLVDEPGDRHVVRVNNR